MAAVSLAVTEPQKALLELALLRDQWDELEQIHSKAASYVSTLESMLRLEHRQRRRPGRRAKGLDR